MCTLLGQAAIVVLACASPGVWISASVDGRPALAFERAEIAAQGQRGTRAVTFSCNPAEGTANLSLVVRPEGKRNRKPPIVLIEGRSVKTRFTVASAIPASDGLVAVASEPKPVAEAFAPFSKEGPVDVKVAGRKEILYIDAAGLVAINAFRTLCAQAAA